MYHAHHAEVVQERLGHSNIGVTLDTYTHVVRGLEKAAALSLTDGLNSTKPELPASQE